MKVEFGGTRAGALIVTPESRVSLCVIGPGNCHPWHDAVNGRSTSAADETPAPPITRATHPVNDAATPTPRRINVDTIHILLE